MQDGTLVRTPIYAMAAAVGGPTWLWSVIVIATIAVTAIVCVAFIVAQHLLELKAITALEAIEHKLAPIPTVTTPTLAMQT